MECSILPDYLLEWRIMMQFEAGITIPPEENRPFVLQYKSGRHIGFEDWLPRLVPKQELRKCGSSEPGYVTWEINRRYLPTVLDLVKCCFKQYNVSRGQSESKSQNEGQLSLFVL